MTGSSTRPLPHRFIAAMQRQNSALSACTSLPIRWSRMRSKKDLSRNNFQISRQHVNLLSASPLPLWFLLLSDVYWYRWSHGCLTRSIPIIFIFPTNFIFARVHIISTSCFFYLTESIEDLPDENTLCKLPLVISRQSPRFRVGADFSSLFAQNKKTRHLCLVYSHIPSKPHIEHHQPLNLHLTFLDKPSTD